MLENVQWLLISAGLLVSVVLALFILRQVRVLLRARQEQAERDGRWQKQKVHLNESVQVLARCMIEGQVELSEGCIRIKVLLDTLAPELNADPRFAIFQRMFEAMEHMPTHQARQQTDRRFIRKMDLQRFQLERENRSAILQAARELLDLNLVPPNERALPLN